MKCKLNWQVQILKSKKKLVIFINHQDLLMIKELQNGNQIAVVHIIHVRESKLFKLRKIAMPKNLNQMEENR